MLHSLWTETLNLYSDEIAVHDISVSQKWTFHDINVELEKQACLSKGSLHPASISQRFVPFLVQTLRAWRDEAVLCPLEKENHPLSVSTEIPENIAHLKLTSGSTGQAKIVMMTAQQISADAMNLKSTMGLNRGFPNLAVISAAHSYGFSNLVTPLLLQGHPIVVVPDALPSSLRAAFALQHTYTLPAVPAMWQAWHRLNLLKEARIALAISAGAPLSLDLETDIFETTGLKIHNFYGSSECGGIAYDESLTPRKDPSYVGKRVENVELSIGSDGCLQVSGPAVAEGYLTQDPDSISGLQAGQFLTSDQVKLEGDKVFILGRISDAINVAGRKLYPQDVENATLRYNGVKHVVAFGIPSLDSARCEECVAVIHPEAHFSERALHEVWGQELAMWQKPRHLWICHKLAPDIRGKISRYAWKRKFLSQQGEARCTTS